jgi:hypothetical protein
MLTFVSETEAGFKKRKMMKLEAVQLNEGIEITYPHYNCSAPPTGHR